MSTGKKDSFPLGTQGVRARLPVDSLEAEQALLLNPCEDDPSLHLEFAFDTDYAVSFIVPRQLSETADAYVRGDKNLSLKGATSIHVYGLNRVGLVQARTEVLRRLEFLGTLMIDLKSFADELLPQQGTPDEEMRQRAHKAVNGFADRVLTEMRGMANPTAPYSEMVKAWLNSFASRVADA